MGAWGFSGFLGLLGHWVSGFGLQKPLGAEDLGLWAQVQGFGINPTLYPLGVVSLGIWPGWKL